MVGTMLKRAGELLADYVASDRADLLTRQLTAALDEKRALLEALAQKEAALVTLRAEHERQRGAMLASYRDLSEAQRLASARDCDWAWAQERLREGKVLTHPILQPHATEVGFPPRLRRIGTDEDFLFRLETFCTRSLLHEVNYPGTVGWRVVDPPPASEGAHALGG